MNSLIWEINPRIPITDDDENVQISGPVVFEQYEVTADYKKKNKNDISLTAGDIVDVIEKNDYGESLENSWVSCLMKERNVIRKFFQKCCHV